MPKPFFTADDLAFQAAIAEGALGNLAANVQNVPITDLFNVLEAFDKLNQAVKKFGHPSS